MHVSIALTRNPWPEILGNEWTSFIEPEVMRLVNKDSFHWIVNC